MSEDPMEELADYGVVDIREFLQSEESFIHVSQEIMEKILSWENILAHLVMAIPPHLDALLSQIEEGLMDIREILKSSTRVELKIEKDEKETLMKLSKDFAHLDWVTVKKDMEEELKDEKEEIKTQTRELHDLHSKFRKLRKFMDESHLKDILNQDNIAEKQKEDFENTYEHYFTEIYKFIKASEEILRGIIVKEKHSKKHLKKDTKKMPN